MDRGPWQKQEFTKSDKLLWQCPYCQGARLTLSEKSLQIGQTADSLRASEMEAFEPEWTEGRFACLLACSHCEGMIAVAGTYRVQDDRYYDPVHGESGGYQSYFRPQFFSDVLPIIMIPDGVPEAVAESLRISFGLFWYDPESAANRIRKAVERLLTALPLPRTTGRRPRRERVLVTLQERISRFAELNPDLGEKLLAVKWLGNAGSHAGGVNEEDVLDGYEILSFVLDELYQGRREQVAELSRTINRRKGPRSAGPRRDR